MKNLIILIITFFAISICFGQDPNANENAFKNSKKPFISQEFLNYFGYIDITNPTGGLEQHQGCSGIPEEYIISGPLGSLYMIQCKGLPGYQVYAKTKSDAVTEWQKIKE